MKTATLTLELLSWWHAGSGLGRGGDADALVIRNKDGLPYLPGKTLKGLVRDAVQLAEDHRAVAAGRTEELFGQLDRTTPNADGTQLDHDPRPRTPGLLQVTSAALASDFSTWLEDGGQARKAAFFEAISSTALNNDGVAEDRTLRTIEVCPPLTLTAKVSGPDDCAWLDTLRRCVPLVRSLGSHRHRGLGRCQVTLTADPPSRALTGNASLPPTAAAEGCVWLDIELLSDVIVSLSAATTGGHDSLDYLPGSALLGAAAARLFAQPGFGPEVFLSGKVRFGDGLPLAPDGCLGRPVPLNCQFIKQHGPVGKPINGLTDTDAAETERKKNKQQAQQLRAGHLTHCGMRFDRDGDYLLKTALDRGKFGRAKDRQLFEYATLAAGSRFRAAIRWDSADATLANKVGEIVRALTGPDVRFGRSRSAQFGQAQITVALHPGDEPQSLNDGVAADEAGAPKHPLHFYLASDLGLAGAGGARLVPEPGDFGLTHDWQFRADRSFVRTRRYSPWNAFHNSRLTERQVNTRGSVLTFARADDQQASPAELQTVSGRLAMGIGEHREEGLGWVMLNPDFVLNLPELKKPSRTEPSVPRNLQPPASASLLADWITRRQTDRAVQTEALNQGRAWANKWLPFHEKAANAERLGRSGRSQWNEVRQLAVRSRGDAAKLRQLLTEHCDHGLRKKYWQHDTGHPQLWKELQAALDTSQDRGGQFACAAIAVAAETIVRRLQAKDDGRTDERPNGHIPTTEAQP